MRGEQLFIRYVFPWKRRSLLSMPLHVSIANRCRLSPERVETTMPRFGRELSSLFFQADIPDRGSSQIERFVADDRIRPISKNLDGGRSAGTSSTVNLDTLIDLRIDAKDPPKSPCNHSPPWSPIPSCLAFCLVGHEDLGTTRAKPSLVKPSISGPRNPASTPAMSLFRRTTTPSFLLLLSRHSISSKAEVSLQATNGPVGTAAHKVRAAIFEPLSDDNNFAVRMTAETRPRRQVFFQQITPVPVGELTSTGRASGRCCVRGVLLVASPRSIRRSSKAQDSSTRRQAPKGQRQPFSRRHRPARNRTHYLLIHPSAQPLRHGPILTHAHCESFPSALGFAEAALELLWAPECALLRSTPP